MLKSRKYICALAMAAMLFSVIAPGIAAAEDKPAPVTTEAAPAVESATPAPSGGIVATTTDPNRSTYEQGLRDGEAAAVKHYSSGVKAAWFLAGLGTGIIGTGIAYLSKPNSTAAKYIQQPCTSEYEKGFKEGFCKFANKTRGAWAAGGWGTWVAMVLASGGSGGD